MSIRSKILLCGLLLSSLLVSQKAQPEELAERLRIASDNYEQVITEQLSHNGQRSYADWLVLAQAYLTANNKDAALAALEQAGELATGNQQQAHVALLQAKVYGILFRDTQNAISYLQQADTLLHASNSIAEQQLYSEVLTNFAQAHNQLGDLAKAGQFARQSLTLSLSLNDPQKELAARIMLGRLALQNNRFDQAHHQLQQALLLADKLNDADARASIHFRLGMAFRKIGEHALALEHMQQAAGLYQNQKNLSSYSYALVYMAESHLENPEGIAQAEQYLLEALAISEQINNVMRTAIVKQSLARVSMLRGDNQQAARYYNEALQQFRQIGAQTYVQESALALAELLILQQQFLQGQQIITELSPTMDNAANYLQARYYNLRAQLAEQQQDWQQAYQFQQQASKLQFAELTITTTDKLSELNDQLSQSSAQQQSHAELIKQQQAQQRELWRWRVTVLVLGMFAILAGYLAWRQKKRYSQTQSLRLAFLLSHSWSRFCERLQQDSRSKQPLHLLAIALQDSQQLKLNQGEETLRQPVQAILQNLTDVQLAGCCINSDVLWLGYRASAEDAAHFSRQLEHEIQLAVAPLASEGRLISLQLDVTQLLGSHWQARDLTTLREAFWLCWKLASLQDDPARCWQLQLTTEQPRPCEWHSSNIRSDMLNALQLGALKLTLNQELLPTNLSARLAGDQAETGED
ncbi:Tfp pilus assembly protein PilF [Arsukibacterium tuosuense]|uniref:Tfp pilus assembly protein PilF n=1 Tax=Arsukibacterium tuosuense TaxID=1323745 RepID=A0A285JIP6_9GAMM|nr:tetratricopeptide repeat protein [Arsukibacterium tuosuense]SNY60135.1 Tfp pilus assembly protein PilF [Arsukibacterium tuosuense]